MGYGALTVCPKCARFRSVESPTSTRNILMKTAVASLIISAFLVGAPQIRNDTFATEAPSLAQAIWTALTGGK